MRRRLLRHPSPDSLPGNLAITLGIVALLRAAIARWLPIDWTTELPLEAVIVMVATAAVRWFLLRPVKDSVNVLRTIASIDTGAARAPLLYWLEQDLEGRRKGLHDLLGTHGWHLSIGEYNEFMKSLARASDGSYTGTTGDLPSVWVDRYSWVFASRDRRSGKANSCRVLIVGRDDLRKDRDEHPEHYDHFVKWHLDNDVGLYGVDPAAFAELDCIFKLGRYITLWEKYAIKSTPLPDGRDGLKVATHLVIPHGDALDELKDYEEYVRELKPLMKRLELYIGNASEDSPASAVSPNGQLQRKWLRRW